MAPVGEPLVVLDGCPSDAGVWASMGCLANLWSHSGTSVGVPVIPAERSQCYQLLGLVP